MPLDWEPPCRRPTGRDLLSHFKADIITHQTFHLSSTEGAYLLRNTRETRSQSRLIASDTPTKLIDWYRRARARHLDANPKSNVAADAKANGFRAFKSESDLVDALADDRLGVKGQGVKEFLPPDDVKRRCDMFWDGLKSSGNKLESTSGVIQTAMYADSLECKPCPTLPQRSFSMLT